MTANYLTQPTTHYPLLIMIITKQINQYDIEIDSHSGRVAIVGDYNSNFGRIYMHNITRFNRHPRGEEHDWNRPQVLGMEWDYGLMPAVTKWIYSIIRDGHMKP